MIEFNKQHQWLCKISYAITMACNNRCPYCTVLNDLNNALLFDQAMTEKVIEETLKFKENNPQYTLRVQFKGGEPLLVADKVIDFMERTKCERTEFLILSNFNFKPRGSKIDKIKEYAKNLDKARLSILVSAHESSNIEFVKQNLLDLREFVENKFLIDNTNIDYVYNFAKWCVENKIPYSVRDIRSTLYGFKVKTIFNYSAEKVKYVLDNADTFSGDVTWDDKRLTPQEVKAMDLQNISKKYWTVCKLASFNISYTGNITSASCGYPLRGHINDGIVVNEFLCNGYECYCTTDDYKKLLRER